MLAILLFPFYLHAMSRIAPLKILKASAGSGKTFSLTLHYLTLLLSNENSYREILAVTFTNKATAEMKERILTVLRGLATGDTSTNIHDFRTLLLAENQQWSAVSIREEAYRVYRKILHDYSHFTVSTIDGFSQKVIRNFTYELNLDAAYKIEMNTSKVKADLTVMLNQLLDERPDLIDWIIQYAEKKIANNENWNYRRQLISLAGLIFSENFQEFDRHLHSVKTHDVFALLNEEVSRMTAGFLEALRKAIQAFNETFASTGVTADEMKGKSRNKLISAGKIHANITKLSATDLGGIIAKYRGLIDNEDAFTDQHKSVRYDLMALFDPILQTISDLERLFPTFVAYQAVQANLYFLRLLKEMSDLLSQWRKENSAQLISDAQILLNQLGLDVNDDPTFIWEKIGNRYRYFLFDEFQDTSRIQWKNYRPLLLNALGSAAGNVAEHLIVGDVKQSIYRWRNGDWRILLQQAEEQITRAFHLDEQSKDRLISNETLDTNYRSLPNIIAFNNHIYTELPTKIQEVLNEKVTGELSEDELVWWQESGNAHMIVKAYENSCQTIPSKRLAEGRPLGAIDIIYFPVEDGRFRRNRVADKSVVALCAQVGDWISSGKYEAKQIGILVRTNAEAQQVIHALMRYKDEHHLTFDVISGDALRLSANDAVLLLIQTLKAIAYELPQQSIYKANIAYLYSVIAHGRVFDDDLWLRFKDNDIAALDAALPTALLDKWLLWQRLPLVQLVENLIEVYGLTNKNDIHIPYLLAFKDLTVSFSASGERGILQFLEYWEEDGAKSVLPSAGQVDAIEVTTVHKSKGLAYDVVMLPFASWNLDGRRDGDFWINVEDTPFQALGKIPVKYTSSLGDSLFKRQYFEEMLFNYMDALNTLYVATTRAKSHLYITAPYFKEKVDKKTGEIQGADIKNEYISDVLHQVLYDTTSPFQIQEKELHVQETNSNETKEGEDKGSGVHTILVEQYPISKELDQVWSKSAKRPIASILTVEKAARYGILAHDILSQATSMKGVDILLDNYVEDGILAHEDRENLTEQIQEIWQHPQMSIWLNGDYHIWNEASIINMEGETIRPDKVFTNDNEAIVLDFKFTQRDYARHKIQVDVYVAALRNLGYENVKGFLYYAINNHLEKVV